MYYGEGFSKTKFQFATCTNIYMIGHFTYHAQFFDIQLDMCCKILFEKKIWTFLLFIDREGWQQ